MKKKTSVSEKVIGVLLVYAKTQLLLIIIVTLLSWFMLSRLGVQFAFLLAFITGSASIVPVIGITASAIIASEVAIFDSARFLPSMSVLVEGLIVLVLYGILNIVIDYLLAPYLIGKSTKIHPVILLVGVLVGASLFGAWGAFLAVPVVLIIKTVLEYNA